MSREIKFRAWDGKTMFEPAQITFAATGWWVEQGHGVSIPFQPHITLMQFTGLKDKNGKEIYEEDIVECPWPRKVFWDDCSWAVKPGICFIFDAARHSKVIGNVHENPELLEGA